MGGLVVVAPMLSVVVVVDVLARQERLGMLVRLCLLPPGDR